MSFGVTLRAIPCVNPEFFFSFLGEFFSKKGNISPKNRDLKGFSPFFEIKIIKFVTSRPRHFLGRHL